MSLFVFFAILFAAFLHASWNGIIKLGPDKLQGIILLSLAHAIVGLVMVFIFPLPSAQTLPWLAGAVVFHGIYKGFLAAAYAHGDLSRVYPIARGTAPVMVLLVGFLILPDQIASLQILGILILGLGILLMSRGIFSNGESAKLLPFALMSAVGTAGYSLIDGMGARVAGNAGSFVAWLYLLDGTIFTLWGIYRRGLVILPTSTRIWSIGLFAGMISSVAFGIVVWAMTVAPIPIVTALRETSVLFAVLIGVVFFKERADRGKLIAAAVIVSGIILIRI